MRCSTIFIAMNFRKYFLNYYTPKPPKGGFNTRTRGLLKPPLGGLGVALLILFSITTRISAQTAEVKFGQNRVQYKDFAFQYYESDHFITYFYPGGQDIARYVIKAAEDNGLLSPNCSTTSTRARSISLSTTPSTNSTRPISASTIPTRIRAAQPNCRTTRCSFTSMAIMGISTNKSEKG